MSTGDIKLLGGLVSSLAVRLDAVERRLAKLESEAQPEPIVAGVASAAMPSLSPLLAPPPLPVPPPLPKMGREDEKQAGYSGSQQEPASEQTASARQQEPTPGQKASGGKQEPPPGQTASSERPRSSSGEATADRELGLEAKIGSYWLNRVGLVTLLVGVVSLLLYSFQYFGPGPKIAFGFVCAAALVGLSRFSGVREKPWFAHGFNALGWSIGFFTGYAMYFVPDLRLLHSAIAELVILSAIAAGMMFDAVRFKSEFTATLSTVFAAIAICLSAAAANPFVALDILIVAAAALSVRQKWSNLLLAATVSFYLALAYIGSNALNVSELTYCLFLFAGWAAVHAAVYFAQSAVGDGRKMLVATTVLNALLASGCIVHEMHQLNVTDAPTAYLWTSLVLSGLYLVTAFAFNRRQDGDLRTVHILLGLSFLNVGKWVKLTGVTVAVADIIEMGLLAIVGARFDIKAFRWFAAFLAFYMVPESVSNGWAVGVLATSVNAFASYIYRNAAIARSVEPGEGAVFSDFHLTLANVVCSWVILSTTVIENSSRLLLLATQLVANSRIALWCRSRYQYAMNSVLGICVAFCAFDALGGADRFSWLYLAISCSLFYGFSLYCRQLVETTSDDWARTMKYVYSSAATLLLTLLILSRVPANSIAIAIGLEGLALIAGGFILREKVLRIFGLIAFSICGVRLLFFDLASAPTVQRIVSFLVTGIILVGCSYGYSWFGKMFSGDGERGGKKPGA